MADSYQLRINDVQKVGFLFACILWAFAVDGVVVRADDLLDRLQDKLTFSAFDDQFRLRLSHVASMEGYAFEEPPAGFVSAESNALFFPRFTTFVDSQIGSQIYGFAQFRYDRGFHQGDNPMEWRADAYALRYTPWDDGRLNLQVGKFGTPIGNWVPRQHPKDNPFITAPFPYEHRPVIFGELEDFYFSRMVTQSRNQPYTYSPVIWGPVYSTGAMASGQIQDWTYAFEFKHAPMISRPVDWELSEVQFDHPTVAGRIGWIPNPMWNLGMNASKGVYLMNVDQRVLPAGSDARDFQQTLLGADIGFAWHHLQVWGEVYHSRYTDPLVGAADAYAYYVETKYRFTPRFYGAIRWNQFISESIYDEFSGRHVPWVSNAWRSDVAVGYRISAHSLLKLQYSFQYFERGPKSSTQLIAAQLSVWF